MYHTSDQSLQLRVEKIQVLKADETDQKQQFKCFFSIQGRERIINNLFFEKTRVNIYFFIFSESNFVKYYNLLTSDRRFEFINNLQQRDTDKIASNQLGVFSMPLTNFISNKSDLEVKSNSSLCLSFDFVIDYNSSRINQSRHLLAFIDTAESRLPNPLSSVVYEKILDYDSVKNNLHVPTKREAFFIKDEKAGDLNGNIYDGKYHYHSKDAPTADGYVGWMASHEDGSMGFRLDKVQVDNYKTQDLRNLKKDIKQTTKLNSPKLYQALGKDLESQTLNSTSATADQNLLAELINNSIASNLNKNNSFIAPETSKMSFFRVSSNSGDRFLDFSYCGSVISINEFLIAQNNTALGPFINFHRRRGNESLARSIVKASKILNFSIIRKKTKDRSFAKKEKAGKNLEQLSQDLLERRLISTTDSGTGFVQIANSRSSIEEIKISNPLSSKANPDIRTVLLKDFDLFHNYDSGQFTYEIELTVQDGSGEFINKLYENFKNVRLQYEKYIEELSIPAYYDDRGNLLGGNYNYKSKKPSRTFTTTPPAARQVVDDLFMEMSGADIFLHGYSSNNTEIKKSLLPQVFDPDIASIILKQAKKVESQLLRILQTISPAHAAKNNEISTQKSKVSSSYSLPKGIFMLKQETKIVHDLDSLNNLVADCAPATTIGSEVRTIIQMFSDKDQLQFLNNPNSVSMMGQAEILPSKFCKIKKSRYEVKHENNITIKDSNTLERKLILLSENPSIEIEKKQTNNVPGLDTVALYSEYKQKSVFEKQKLDTIISAIRANSDLVGIKDSTMELFSKLTFTSESGLSIDLEQDKNEDLDLISAGTFLGQALDSASPDISDDLRAALVSSFFQAESRTQLEKDIEENFKSLISIKNSLGEAYSKLSIFSSLKQKMFTNKIRKVDFEKVFKEGSDKELSFVMPQVKDNFEEESYNAELVVPGVGSKKLTPLEIVSLMENSSAANSSSNLMFLKFNTYKSSKIRLINDGFVLRG